jgi:hypothetical protein
VQALCFFTLYHALAPTAAATGQDLSCGDAYHRAPITLLAFQETNGAAVLMSIQG